MIQSDPSGQFVLHVDLGLDKIFINRFDPSSGLLTPNEPPFVELPAGDGPRHFHFHPNGKVVLFGSRRRFDGGGIRLQLNSRYAASSTNDIELCLPDTRVATFCSEILVSPDGRFVYAGNRLYDSIAMYSVGEDGLLNYIGEEWTRVIIPEASAWTQQVLICMLQSTGRQCCHVSCR